MNNISLTQVTAFVIAVSMASFFVNDDAHAHAHARSAESNSTVDVEIATNPTATEQESVLNDKFTFTSLDTDKDGKLNHQEVLAGKNEWLVKSFKKIDSNADELITEQELVDFVAKTTAASH